jgi:hypothetical protein
VLAGGLWRLRNDAKFFNNLDDTAFSANLVASIVEAISRAANDASELCEMFMQHSDGATTFPTSNQPSGA